MLTQELLKEFTEYDPDTGIFRWRKLSGYKGFVGKTIGSVHSCGYLEARIAGRRCFLHRAAWLYVTGEMPRYIDHINGDRTDNRWVNLRNATAQQNGANARVGKNNKSGKKGAHLSERGVWIANIHVNHKTIYLGSFTNKDEAHEAYVQAANKHFGEFARAE